MHSFLILGDPHLGRSTSQGKVGLGSHLNSRIADQINLLDWTLDQAIERHIDQIIITGDIFHEPKPPPSLITLFISWLKRCQAYHTNVRIVLGNHDLFRSGTNFTSSLDIIIEMDLDNVWVYKNIDTLFLDHTAITILPFRDRKSFQVSSNKEALSLLQHSLDYELASIPAPFTKVIIGHLAIEGSIPVGDEIDDLTNELFCPLSMFQGYDYVWMGHVHNPQVMKKSPHIAHIGSMDISNFGETEQKKQIIIYDCHTNSFTTELLPNRKLKKISITVPKEAVNSTEYVMEQLKEHQDLHNSIVRLEVSLLAPELSSVNKRELEAKLIDLGAFNVSNISESKKISLLKKTSSTIDTKMDVVSSIKNYAKLHLEKEKQAEFIDLALDIHSSFLEDSKN